MVRCEPEISRLGRWPSVRLLSHKGRENRPAVRDRSVWEENVRNFLRIRLALKIICLRHYKRRNGVHAKQCGVIERVNGGGAEQLLDFQKEAIPWRGDLAVLVYQWCIRGVSGKPSTNIRKVADHEPTIAVRHRDPHLTLAELPQLAPDRAGPIRSHQPQGALHLFRVIAPAVIGILEEIIGSTVVEPTPVSHSTSKLCIVIRLRSPHSIVGSSTCTEMVAPFSSFTSREAR